MGRICNLNLTAAPRFPDDIIEYGIVQEMIKINKNTMCLILIIYANLRAIYLMLRNNKMVFSIDATNENGFRASQIIGLNRAVKELGTYNNI